MIFPMQIPLLGAIPEEAKSLLWTYMISKRVGKGERLISQGDDGDSLYVIQEGSCVVSVEKDGILHAINRLGAGDVMGEMALLTGERRTAHVDAETDMTLWCLARSHFDALCKDCPDLRDFLTELATHRFSTESYTANRAVGKYVLHEILGRGGWSIVYKGVHADLNMPVAIKMLKHTLAMHDDFQEKFRNEAKTIAKLNHENIVKVYDIEKLFRTIFIIMEYLEGIPLNTVLKNVQRLSLFMVLDIVIQVCNGLAYAHEQGIVHQDIKPANIFMQSDGRAKIVDFGLSCSPGTIDFGLPGTVFYMAPEQIEGESVDERTDIYSLGITAYEMIAGTRPYPEDDIGKLMQMHVHEDVPDLRALVPDLPTEICRFVKRAVERDASRRYPNVREILRDLRPLAERIGVRKQPEPSEQRKMMSLFLFYDEGKQLALNRVLEELVGRLREIGIVLKAADFTRM
jgi:tRNA A-37 threonylcarbamoyl transferase component Bud32